MAQHVLAVAGAEVEAAQQVDDPLVEVVDFGFLGGFLADLLDVPPSLLGVADDLFDSRRVDAAIGDQAVEREPRDLAADHVERATMTTPGVSSMITSTPVAFSNARGCSASFAADDPPLHFVVGDVDGARGGLGGARGVRPEASEHHLGKRSSQVSASCFSWRRMTAPASCFNCCSRIASSRFVASSRLSSAQFVEGLAVQIEEFG